MQNKACLCKTMKQLPLIVTPHLTSLKKITTAAQHTHVTNPLDKSNAPIINK